MATSKDSASDSKRTRAVQGCRRDAYFRLLLIGYFGGLDAGLVKQKTKVAH